jgi:uncharacterized repeat protein (TIGR02543 family)
MIVAEPKTGYAGYGPHSENVNAITTGILNKYDEVLILKLFYEPSTFTVSYMTYDNSQMAMMAGGTNGTLIEFKPAEIKVPGEKVFVDYENTAIEGFIFSGWYTSDARVVKNSPSSFVMPQSNVTFIGSWTSISSVQVYTVVFLNSDGAHLKTEHVPGGGDATAPFDPYLEGYTFTGWVGSYTDITDDTIIVAAHTQDTKPADTTPPPFEEPDITSINTSPLHLPRTGDENNINFWFVIMILSVIAAVRMSLFLKMKKERR